MLNESIHINVAQSPNSINNNHTMNNSNNNSTNTMQSMNVETDVIKPDSLLQRRIIQPFIDILKSGATSHGITLSVACGVSAGLFPVPATTSIIVLILVYIFKLNIAMCQLMNLIMTPFNLASFIYFIHYGNYIFGVVQKDDISLELIQSDPLNAVQLFGMSLLRGIAVWIIVAPLVTALVYFILKPVITTLLVSMSKPKLNP